MSQNKITHLIVASALCGALMLPFTAQAKGKASGKRNDATKVVDATTLPGRKVLHGAKKVGEVTEHNIGHAFKSRKSKQTATKSTATTTPKSAVATTKKTP